MAFYSFNYKGEALNKSNDINPISNVRREREQAKPSQDLHHLSYTMILQIYVLYYIILNTKQKLMILPSLYFTDLNCFSKCKFLILVKTMGRCEYLQLYWMILLSLQMSLFFKGEGSCCACQVPHSQPLLRPQQARTGGPDPALPFTNGLTLFLFIVFKFLCLFFLIN